MIFTGSVFGRFIALHALKNKKPQTLYATNWTGTKYETLQNKHFSRHSKGSTQSCVSWTEWLFPWRRVEMQNITLHVRFWLEHIVWNFGLKENSYLKIFELVSFGNCLRTNMYLCLLTFESPQNSRGVHSEKSIKCISEKKKRNI